MSLLERIATGDIKSRMAALSDAIGAEDEPGLIDAITQALSDAEPKIRRSALETIALTSDAKTLAFPPSIGARILALSRDEAWNVRAESAVALATVSAINPTDASMALLRLLRDDTMEVRQEAAAALGDLASVHQNMGRDVCEPLAEMLGEDQHPSVRFEAAFALASLRDERALPLLLASLGGPRFTDACEGLKRLGDARAIEPLRAHAARFFLGWPERMVAHATIYALGGEDEGRAYLLGKLDAWSRSERELAIATLGHMKIEAARERIEAIARDPKDRSRAAAITALGELGGERAREVLGAITDAPVAEDVAHALAQIRPKGRTL